jgi:hypothetical protein
MSPTMHFETVSLEKIKHIIERAGRNGQNVDIPIGQNHKPRRKAPKRKFLLFDQVTGQKMIVTADEIGLQNFSTGE